MNRLMKELRDRGIVYETNEIDVIFRGPEHDCAAHLVTVTDKVLVIAWYSAVLPPRFELYDRITLKHIADQDMYKDDNPPFYGFRHSNPWEVSIYNSEEPDEDYYEAMDWAFAKED